MNNKKPVEEPTLDNYLFSQLGAVRQRYATYLAPNPYVYHTLATIFDCNDEEIVGLLKSKYLPDLKLPSFGKLLNHVCQGEYVFSVTDMTKINGLTRTFKDKVNVEIPKFSPKLREKLLSIEDEFIAGKITTKEQVDSKIKEVANEIREYQIKLLN